MTKLIIYDLFFNCVLCAGPVKDLLGPSPQDFPSRAKLTAGVRGNFLPIQMFSVTHFTKKIDKIFGRHGRGAPVDGGALGHGLLGLCRNPALLLCLHPVCKIKILYECIERMIVL